MTPLQQTIENETISYLQKYSESSFLIRFVQGD